MNSNKIVVVGLGLLTCFNIFSQQAATINEPTKIFYDDVVRMSDLAGDIPSAFKHSHIKLVNETKVPAVFTLFYRNQQGEITPLKFQDKKGNESAEAHTFTLQPTKGIFFVHGKYNFRNATGECIVRAEAKINGETLQLDGKWCPGEIKNLVGKVLGHRGYRIILKDTNEGKRVLESSKRY